MARLITRRKLPMYGAALRMTTSLRMLAVSAGLRCSPSDIGYRGWAEVFKLRSEERDFRVFWWVCKRPEVDESTSRHSKWNPREWTIGWRLRGNA